VRLPSRCSTSLTSWRCLAHYPTCFIHLQLILLRDNIQLVALLGNKQVNISPQLGLNGLLLSCMSWPGYIQNCRLGLHTFSVSQIGYIYSHTTSKILCNHQGILSQSMYWSSLPSSVCRISWSPWCLLRSFSLALLRKFRP
jgi:hypothetical protein